MVTVRYVHALNITKGNQDPPCFLHSRKKRLKRVLLYLPAAHTPNVVHCIVLLQ